MVTTEIGVISVQATSQSYVHKVNCMSIDAGQKLSCSCSSSYTMTENGMKINGKWYEDYIMIIFTCFLFCAGVLYENIEYVELSIFITYEEK